MSTQEAIDLVKLHAAASSEPPVDNTDVETVLEQWKLPDSFGRLPDDAEWDPTYLIAGAVSDVFKLKAARVASSFGFTADGASYNREQMFEHYTQLAEQWSRRATLAKNGGVTVWDPMGAVKSNRRQDTFGIVP